MANLVNKNLLTDSGRDFLIAAMDPMHDTQLKELQGWPDVETSSSIVRCIKQTVTISKPTTLLAGETWDCIIESWPFLTPQTLQKQARLGGNDANNVYIQDPSFSTTVLGGVTARGIKTGNDYDYDATQLRGQVALASAYEKGATRVVGCGIEVMDTTADIYKQGNCTVFRNNQSAIDRPSLYTKNMAAPFTTLTQFTGSTVRRGPKNQQEALLIPGSRQWRAEDGCYLVQSFVGQDNPARMPDYVLPVVPATSVEDEVSVAGNTTQFFSPQMTLAGGAAIAISPCIKLHPTHMAGAIFSGLNENSTLQMTVNYYIESFPTPAEADILVLASPSARYDPVALEIFSQALSEMPVGVMACENGLGDWFRGAVAIALKAAPAVLSGLGLGALAPAAKLASRAYDTYMAAPSPQQLPPTKRRDTEKKRKTKAKKDIDRSVAVRR